MPTIESISAPRLRYSQQLDDQRWKWKADNIRKRDEHKCRGCGKSNRQLDVHHIRYVEGRQAWDYDESDLVTLCHECHEKVHEHQEFIDSLHGGSLFYDTGFKGVGIVERFYDNGIWFHICWTEAETYEGVNHGRLYVEAETSFVNMRKPTEDEIIEFWGDIDKYCSDWMIIHYVNRYYDLIPQNHSLLKRIDQIKKSGEFYNDGSPDHQALAIKYFENYVVENGYLKKETDIIFRDILFNPFYLRYNISILYKFQNDQGQWEEKEISGIVCFDIENDGSYSIRLNGNKKG